MRCRGATSRFFVARSTSVLCHLRQRMDTTRVADSNGFFVSDSEDVKTSYDLTFGQSELDTRPALGRCVTQQYIQRRCLARWEPQPQASGCGRARGMGIHDVCRHEGESEDSWNVFEEGPRHWPKRKDCHIGWQLNRLDHRGPSVRSLQCHLRLCLRHSGA